MTSSAASSGTEYDRTPLMETIPVPYKTVPRLRAMEAGKPEYVPDPFAEAKAATPPVRATIRTESASPSTPTHPVNRRGTPAACLRRLLRSRHAHHTFPQVSRWSGEKGDGFEWYRSRCSRSRETKRRGHPSCPV